MVVRGFVGTFDDSINLPIRGNGKTLSMVYFAYRLHQDGWEVYSNFKTTFSKYLPVDDMIRMFMDRGETFHHVVFLVDEVQQYIESLGNTSELKIFMGMVRQLRHRYSHLYWTSQRYLDVGKRFRIQTDEIFQPVKIHTDGRTCMKDICEKDHLIIVQRVRPYYPRPLKILNAVQVGKMYRTDEIIIDKITVPKKVK